MGRTYDGPDRHFAPVRVSDTFTIFFLQKDHCEPYHLGFHVSDADVDHIVGQLSAANIPYGNDPRDHTNMRTDHPFGGRGRFSSIPTAIYWK